MNEQVVLNPRPERLVTRGDMLIVLGEDNRIDRFAKATSDATLHD